MRVCPRSADGKHHYIAAGYMALCLHCSKEVTLTGVTDQWIKVEKEER